MSIECTYCNRFSSDTAKKCSYCGMPIASAETSWIIICPKCGKVFEVRDENARISECDNCSDDLDKKSIASTRPTKQFKKTEKETSEDNNTPLLTLNGKNINKRICISRNGIIGRKGDIDQKFFAENQYVSERHCRVFYENNQWKVKHLSRTNPTTVNGTEMNHIIPLSISKGDVLGIANLIFDVLIEDNYSANTKSVSTKNSLKTTEVHSNKEYAWEIICPVCGKRYFGEDDSFRVSICTGTCSNDEVDSVQISKILPRRIEIECK